MINSLEKILEMCEQSGQTFWQVILRYDCQERGIPEKTSVDEMRRAYQAMRESDQNYDPQLKSRSGMAGTAGAKLQKRLEEGKMMSGDLLSRISVRALKVAESNACMKRIVAAPTAGSCGIMPAVLLSLQEKNNYSDNEMIRALYVAGGIGGVIAERATISGAAGGCQAEIGSASAMAAGAAVFLCGGTNEEIVHASALALKGLLGLACDPVAGLVEVPCIKRNVIGAVNAITSADMALAGIRSAIDPDQVIDAMKSIGRSMSEDLRETGGGGLAATPCGIDILRRLRAGASEQ